MERLWTVGAFPPHYGHLLTKLNERRAGLGENAESSSGCMWVSRWCPGLGSGAGEGAVEDASDRNGSATTKGF